jgi:hypothetical protein
MKNTFFRLFCVVTAMVLILSCEEKTSDPEPQKTPEELAIEDLTGGSSQTWTVAGGGSVQRNGQSETNLFQDFEITFASTGTNNTYQTSNSNGIFDNSGNWGFVAPNIDRFTLSGTAPAAGQTISFTRTGNDLRLQFSIPFPSSESGRINAIAGDYIFNLKRSQ